MVNKKFSNTERLVLGGLEKDSRKPLSRIAKTIMKSQQNVSYTVGSLSKRDILKGSYAVIDYSKINALNFRVYFKLNYVSREKITELIEHLKNDAHSSWISSCGGRYDLISTFFTSNPSQFNKNLRDIIMMFPDEIRNYTVLTTAVVREFGRKYLFRKKSEDLSMIVGGDREPEDLDTTDMKILNELSQDARKSSVIIGKETSLTPKSVINRINSLRNKKVILGFKPLLDTSNMGYVSNLLLVRYHNITVEDQNELLEYLKSHENVVSVAKTLGEWDIEVEIESPNIIEFRRVEMDIRQRFRMMIQTTESIPLYTTYKKNYFPAFLINSL